MNNDDEFFKYYSQIHTPSNTGMNMNSSFYGNTNLFESNLNPKQLFWINRRKLRRETLDLLMISNNTNYIHESRHRHAMKRMRSPSGRFLNKKEAQEQMKNDKKELNES